MPSGPDSRIRPGLAPREHRATRLVGLSFDSAASPKFSLAGVESAPVGRAAGRAYGWGFAWYPEQSGAALVIKDATSMGDNAMTKLLRNWERFESTTFLAHLRGAARVLQERDTHPFGRAHGGRDWIFAHNGDLDVPFGAQALAEALPLGEEPIYEPIGRTDSERAFCWLLTQARNVKARTLFDIGWARLHGWFRQLDQLGTCNILLSDGRDLVVYADEEAYNPIHQARLLPPNVPKHLETQGLRIGLEDARDRTRTAVVFSTAPLQHESFQTMTPGQMMVVRRGTFIYDSHASTSDLKTMVPPVSRPYPREESTTDAFSQRPAGAQGQSHGSDEQMSDRDTDVPQPSPTPGQGLTPGSPSQSDVVAPASPVPAPPNGPPGYQTQGSSSFPPPAGPSPDGAPFAPLPFADDSGTVAPASPFPSESDPMMAESPFSDEPSFPNLPPPGPSMEPAPPFAPIDAEASGSFAAPVAKLPLPDVRSRGGSTVDMVPPGVEPEPVEEDAAPVKRVVVPARHYHQLGYGAGRLLTVHHETTYRYDAPVEKSSHLFRLQPVHDAWQDLLEYELNISVDGLERNYDDVFGNAVSRLDIEKPFTELVVRANSLVRVRADPADDLHSPHRRFHIPLVWMPWQRQMMTPYLLPPELPETQLRELSDYAMSFVERQDFDLAQTLLDMNTTIYRDYSYVSGSTTMATTPFEVYTQRRGVCQDFANLLICLARLLDIPARYRVGYIFTGGRYDNEVQSDASHAWAELYLPWSGWQGFDPTNGCLANRDHVRVACGRAYNDATPTSGTLYKGGGSEHLRIDVKVEDAEPE